MILDDYIKHLRERPYMSGIERDITRTNATEEFFTPTWVVQQTFDHYLKIDNELFDNPKKTIIDPCCGDGQFLGEVLIRKMENSSTFEQALSTIYGVDLMQDNVELCRERLLCGHHHLRHIVEKNIVCADGLRYHYRFDDSHPYDDEEGEIIFESLFEIG